MKIPYFAGVKPLSASTGGRHFHIISLDTAGLWRRAWEAGIWKTIVNQSSAIVFFSDRAYQNSIELFIPIVHALHNNLAVSRNILRKWQPPIEADYGSDTAKQEFFIRL